MKRFLLATAAFALIVPNVAIAQHAKQTERTKKTVTKTTRTARPAARAKTTRAARPVARVQPTRHTRGVTHVTRPQVQSKTTVRQRTTYRPGSLRTSRYHPIRRPAFRYPSGYSYRRWSIGSILPSLFLSSNYYFNDYAALGVGPPPYGYHWVRYGPDLLLVRNGTRRIVDVIYGAFY